MSEKEPNFILLGDDFMPTPEKKRIPQGQPPRKGQPSRIREFFETVDSKDTEPEPEPEHEKKDDPAGLTDNDIQMSELVRMYKAKKGSIPRERLKKFDNLFERYKRSVERSGDPHRVKHLEMMKPDVEKILYGK